MIVANSIKELKYDPHSIVTIGTFDGVHLGHQLIMSKLTSRAKTHASRSVILTFDPHPREIVGKEQIMLLSTLDERINLMNIFGVDAVLIIKFSYDFSRQTSKEFYEKYMVNGIGLSEVIVGYDHMFGRDRKSNIDELQRMSIEYKFDVNVVEPVSFGGEVISSSKIRNLLSRGDVERAAEYLNRPYSLDGIVIEGDRRGETLGFPTANIQPKSNNKLIPLDGVYFVSINMDNRQYYGMLNIGIRPTFKSDSSRIIEVNIFKINNDLYGKELTIQFLKRIRSEINYSSKEELISQLQSDRNLCMKYITEVQTI